MKPRPQNTAFQGFTLLELLVAMTILSLMLVFMFNLVGRAISAWELGNRRIEAAQAARIGLNRMAADLQFALSASANASALTGTNFITNVVPCLFVSNATSPGGLSMANISVAPQTSDQIFSIVASPDPDAPFTKIGYYTVFINNTNGAVSMGGPGYYLIRQEGGTPNFFYRDTGANTPTNWISVSSADAINQTHPIIDNCIRFRIRPATVGPNGLLFQSNWPSRTNLPAAIMAEITVVDSKTMTKIHRLKGTSPLTAQELDSITNTAPPSGTVETLLRQGAVTMQRLIPFHNSP